MPWTRDKNILPHYSFRDKFIPSCLNIDATHKYENDLLLRQETEKKRNIDFISLAQRMHFYRTCSK